MWTQLTPEEAAIAGLLLFVVSGMAMAACCICVKSRKSASKLPEAVEKVKSEDATSSASLMNRKTVSEPKLGIFQDRSRVHSEAATNPDGPSHAKTLSAAMPTSKTDTDFSGLQGATARRPTNLSSGATGTREEFSGSQRDFASRTATAGRKVLNVELHGIAAEALAAATAVAGGVVVEGACGSDRTHGGPVSSRFGQNPLNSLSLRNRGRGQTGTNVNPAGGVMPMPLAEPVRPKNLPPVDVNSFNPAAPEAEISRVRASAGTERDHKNQNSDVNSLRARHKRQAASCSIDRDDASDDVDSMISGVSGMSKRSVTDRLHKVDYAKRHRKDNDSAQGRAKRRRSRRRESKRLKKVAARLKAGSSLEKENTTNESGRQEAESATNKAAKNAKRRGSGSGGRRSSRASTRSRAESGTSSRRRRKKRKAKADEQVIQVLEPIHRNSQLQIDR